MTELAAYVGLFLAAFAAATIFPFQSEVVLVGLVLTDDYSAVLLLAVASVANTLGSVVNWGLGLGVERMKTWRWFPVSEAQLDRASGWYRRWGKWSLLLSWAPFIGDPLTVAAGVLREPFWSFLALVAIAKTARYAVLVLATLQGAG